MWTMRLFLRLGAAGWMALLTAACGGGDGGRGAADSLYIGVAAAFTGRTDAYFNGVRLAIRHLNAARPDGSPPFALRLPPRQQPTQVRVAASFRDDPAVIGVVGHTGSGQTMEAAPIYGDVEQDGRRAVVAVSPTATNPLVTRGSEWVFRVCPTDTDAARAVARYAADSLDRRRAAVVYRNDLFGRGFLATFREAFEGGGRRVLERDPYLGGVTEYQAYMGRIAQRAADVLVIAGGSDDAAAMVRSLRRFGAAIPVLGSDDLAALQNDTAFVREFGAVRFTAFFLADRARTETAQRFVREYEARYGTSPDHRAALSYDAAMLIGRAVLASGADRQAVREWIAGVGRRREPFPGVTGPIAFNEHGDAVDKPVLIARIGS